MEPRRFRLLGERERAMLGERAGELARDWSERWLPRGGEARLTCAPAAGREAAFTQAAWTRFAGTDVEEWIGAAFGDEQARALGAMLYGAAPVRSSIAADAGRAALSDLVAGLLGGALRAQQAGPLPRATWLPGSAALVLEIDLGPRRIALVASPGWTLRRLRDGKAERRAPPLVRRPDAARGAPCEVRVLAGGASLELRELSGLRVGDVLALDAPLEGALRVELAGREVPELEARLGRLHGQRAVVLAARSE